MTQQIPAASRQIVKYGRLGELNACRVNAAGHQTQYLQVVSLRANHNSNVPDDVMYDSRILQLH